MCGGVRLGLLTFPAYVILSLLALVAMTQADGRADPRRPGGTRDASAAVGSSAPLLVLTGVQGTLEPCGCSGQRGGSMEEVAAQIASARRHHGVRLLVMGPLLETPGAKGFTRQQATKADALARILNLLHADWMVLSEDDRRALHLLRHSNVSHLVPGLGRSRPLIDLQSGASHDASVNAFDGVGGGEDAVIVQIRSGHSHLWIRSRVGGVDLLRTEGEGQLSGHLQHLPARGPVLLEVFERTGGLHARQLPLDDPSLRASDVRKVLMQTFSALHSERQDIVQQDVDIALHVGSRMCAACHANAYAWWRSSGHGQAYATLQGRSRAGDEDCVPCHVTAFDGARLARADASEFHGVGCESCHGAGGQHIELPRTAKLNVRRTVPEETCRSCHDADHGGTFVYSRRLRELVGPGHGP